MKAESIDELLDAERGRKGGFSQEQRAGLWKGIESSIGPIVTPPDATPPDASPPTAPQGNAAPLSGLATKIGALMAVAAIGGAGLGAAAYARWAEPRVVVVERPAAPSVAAAPVAPPAALVPPAPLATELPSVAASALPAAATNRASEPRPVVSAAPPARDPALARERTLLDMARTALSRGDTTAALSSVDNHAREFPASQLAEEREVLAIQALASAGRLPEARRRGAAFRTSFPKSALLPIVDETTQ